MIYKLGPSRVAFNIHVVSWGFFLMLLSKCVGMFSEVMAWKLILGETTPKLGFWKLSKIYLQGSSLNYITLTRMGGEPLKVIAIRDHASLAEAAASVIVLKFSDLLGFWITIGIGFLTIFFLADLSADIKTGVGSALAFLTVFIATLMWIQRKGIHMPFTWLLRQFKSKTEWIKTQVLRLGRLDEHIWVAYRSRRKRIAFAVLLCAASWIEEIFFIWLVLHFLSVREDWFIPIVIGTISLLLNHLFFFVPWRAGTQEGTMVLSFSLLSLSEPVGLSVAILRRMRELVLVFLGLILFALETLRPYSSGDFSSGPLSS